MPAFQLCEMTAFAYNLFVIHCIWCISSGYRCRREYKFLVKIDAFHEIVTTIVKRTGQSSELLFLCGLEEIVLSILGISHISINQIKYTAMKHLSPYERKYKY